MTTIEFNSQIVRLENTLNRFALSLTYNREDAKDLTQDTILKAFTYKEQFVNHTNLKAWMYTIMKNTFINNYRSNIRHKTVLDTTQNLYFLNQSRRVEPAVDSDYSASEISETIEKLDRNFKIPFKMHLEGYKYTEIAEKLGVNLGTIKSRIFFTRKKLMDSLKDYE